MHRFAYFLCLLGLFSSVACGEETPDPDPGTTGSPTSTTHDAGTGGEASTDGASETTGGMHATTSSNGSTAGTTGSSETTGGDADITGETDGGANGDSDAGTTGDTATTTGAMTDAGADAETDADTNSDTRLCSESHPAGGCDTEMIAACVCEGPAAGVEGEPSCCEPAVDGDDTKNGWDEVCQIIAYSEGCAGDCCEIHAEGSCELPSVEKCVCDALPECCLPADDSEVTQNGWDALCLAAAAACGAPCI